MKTITLATYRCLYSNELFIVKEENGSSPFKGAEYMRKIGEDTIFNLPDLEPETIRKVELNMILTLRDEINRAFNAAIDRLERKKK